MVGGNQGRPALVPVQAFQTQGSVEVNVIEAENGKRSRIGARPFEITPDIGFVEMRGHRRCHRTAKPFIKIPKNDTRPAQFLVRDDPLVHEFARLLALLKEACPEMNVENVQYLLGESDIGPQAASPLPSTGADVVVLMALNREPCQDDVAVPSAVVPPILTEGKMETEFLRDKPGLILFPETALTTDNLLKGDDIGVGLAQYLDNPIGAHTPIHATAFVNVISNNPEKRSDHTHESNAAGEGPAGQDTNTRRRYKEPQKSDGVVQLALHLQLIPRSEVFMTEQTISEVRIPSGPLFLEGTLGLPEGSLRVVVFAHGSGSSRWSPRNRFVARELALRGLGTLLLDLLTADEDEVYRTRFDIDLLTTRLVQAINWLKTYPQLQDSRVGLFGASTGAAAALRAAATTEELIHAVVSRGGRPDLAQEYLHRVQCPTLLIVGSHDYDVLTLNRQALASLTCKKRLEIIPGATHLFEEPGKLEEVARLAADWFEQHL
jgi:putative phosphoribosyl transferase